MKRFVLLLIGIVVFSLNPAFAQRGNGNIIKVEQEMPPFTGIKTSGIDDVVLISTGTPYTVTVETDENLQDKIKVTVRNSTLRFSYSGVKPKKLRFYVSVPNLEKLEVSGASNIKSADTVRVNTLHVDASGAADLRLGLKGETINIEAGGAADIHLSGKAQKLYISSDGAADIKAGKLIVDSAFVQASGASDVRISPIHYLHKKVTGAADVKIISGTKEMVSIETGDDNKKVIILENEDDHTVNYYSDTTKIKIGGLGVEVIDADTVKIKVGHHVLVVDDDGDVEWNRCKTPWFNGHWGGVELGINGYVTPDFNTTFGKKYDFLALRYEKSMTVNLNIYEQNFGLNRAKTIGLITGVGFSFNNYRFSQPVYLSPDSINLSGFYMRNVSVRKSKLTAAYITIPLLFEIQSKNDIHSKRFHIAAGGIFSARIGSHTKIYFNEANKQYNLEDPATGQLLPGYYTTPNRIDRNIVKSFNSFSLQPFRVDATFRVGYGPLNLFATYSLTQMFQKNRGPELYHWTVGITLVGW